MYLLHYAIMKEEKIMVKFRRRILRAGLAVLVAATTVCTVMAANTMNNASATDAETVGKYATNPNGTGKRATITIDGKINDWSEDMLIAQGAGWDFAPRWKGAHENSVLDCYSLYAAWDDTNLYIGFQMVNPTDTWATPGEGPLMDNGKPSDVPLGVALSVDTSKPSITGKMTNGDLLWDKQHFSFTNTHADMVLMMSAKPGNGDPALFKVADSQGNLSYDSQYCLVFKSNGIEYKVADDFLPSELWALDGVSTTPEEEVYGGKGNYIDALKKGHDTKYDSFYEMKIPFKVLGITVNDLESKGIGVMQFATRGESPLDCVPHDPAMLDNVMGEYHAGDNTSLEKEDQDDFSVPLARVGGNNTDPKPTEPEEKLILGDVDNNGRVMLSDAIYIQKSLVTGNDLSGDSLKCADVDKNGTANLRDAIIIQRYTLSLLDNSKFGIGELI